MAKRRRRRFVRKKSPYGVDGAGRPIVVDAETSPDSEPGVEVIHLKHGTIELSPVPPDIQQAIHEILVKRGLAADDSPKVRGAIRQAIHDFLVKRGLASPDPEPAAPTTR